MGWGIQVLLLGKNGWNKFMSPFWFGFRSWLSRVKGGPLFGRRLLVISNAFHMARTMEIFRKAGTTTRWIIVFLFPDVDDMSLQVFDLPPFQDGKYSLLLKLMQ